MGALTSSDTERLRAGAGLVADMLLANAIVTHGRATWLGSALAGAQPDVRVALRTGDPTLYDGSAGIALAGWAAAAALGRDDLAEIAVAAARHAVSARDRLEAIGLFDGLAGVGLAALEVGDGAANARLRDEGLDLLLQVAATAPTSVDLISGSSGTVLALLAAAQRTGSERCHAGAVRHGEHVLASANRRSWGWSWPALEGPDLCGLAHGAAGVAWAMGALAAATGDERFAEAVDGARRFERSWFQPAQTGWPDLRPETAAPAAALVCPALWCHGATGIGLSRLALLSLAEHPSLAAEAACALQAATSSASRELRSYPHHGLTLCHGLGGTLLLLLAAYEVLDEPEHLAAARWLAGTAIDLLGDDPAMWPSGAPSGEFSPGLMTGLAGTMYVLARAARPSSTPVLTVLGDQGPRLGPVGGSPGPGLAG